MLHQIKASCPDCGKNLAVVLDRADDEGPRRYFCYWRSRLVAASWENPLWFPAMYGTCDYCPECNGYLPDFVELQADDTPRFYGRSRDELLARMTGQRPTGP